ncbi:hypothetical protein LSG31_13795 [Fodinisporobacter ferrooxydans]|uniref:Uncharacterized protein n=1 Tax=Fodinisporobacter ferrooxydans TaxID=2901836 RepID=A0ABY4CEN3_9BACL|nr:hypothetical protein LSG31_13795 [Alicyclobacillaceae bacterium MYW30-H2]
MDKLSNYITSNLQTMLADLEELVNLDSPTKNKYLTDKAMQFFVKRFIELTGALVEWIPQTEFGDIAKLSIGSGERQTPNAVALAERLNFSLTEASTGGASNGFLNGYRLTVLTICSICTKNNTNYYIFFKNNVLKL